MRRFVSHLISTAVLISFPLISFAWNATGHMVVAEIAYQHLKPEVKHQVDAIVNDFQKDYPEMNTFMDLATWPDTLHSQKIETYSRWHYIDYAFSTDGSPLKNLIDTDNAVWALKNVQTVVKNTRANSHERARFLAFLVHIVGDLHQPLHTVSYISSAHPDGDKGGNSFIVNYRVGKNDTVNLHRLWDMGVGTFNVEISTDTARDLAQTISATYPEVSFGNQAKNLNPNDWTAEGMENAKNYVYNTAENKAPSTSYINSGRKLAEKEAALAGYRLANVLNDLLR